MSDREMISPVLRDHWAGERELELVPYICSAWQIEDATAVSIMHLVSSLNRSLLSSKNGFPISSITSTHVEQTSPECSLSDHGGMFLAKGLFQIAAIRDLLRTVRLFSLGILYYAHISWPMSLEFNRGVKSSSHGSILQKFIPIKFNWLGKSFLGN